MGVYVLVMVLKLGCKKVYWFIVYVVICCVVLLEKGKFCV